MPGYPRSLMIVVATFTNALVTDAISNTEPEG
jgi:hypothetical protein